MSPPKSGDNDEFKAFLQTLKDMDKAKSEPSMYLVKRDALSASISLFRYHDNPDIEEVLELADEIIDWLVKSGEKAN